MADLRPVLLPVTLLVGLGLLVVGAGGSPAAVAAPPNPSVTVVATPPNGVFPLAVTLNATGASGTPPYSFSWNFGDGSAGATGPGVVHVFTYPGTFRVEVTLTDVMGATATGNATVVATPAPLTASLVALPPSFGLGSTTELETSVSGGTPPYSFAWQGLPQGCPSLNVANYSCQPSAAGSFRVLVLVTDHAGAVVNASALLTVIGSPVRNSAAAPTTDWLTLGEITVGVAAAAAAGAYVGWRRRRRT